MPAEASGITCNRHSGALPRVENVSFALGNQLASHMEDLWKVRVVYAFMLMQHCPDCPAGSRGIKMPESLYLNEKRGLRGLETTPEFKSSRGRSGCGCHWWLGSFLPTKFLPFRNPKLCLSVTMHGQTRQATFRALQATFVFGPRSQRSTLERERASNLP